MTVTQDSDIHIHTSIRSTIKQDGFDLPLRVLLYSHDSVGLGHLRRNLAVAGEIANTFPNANILVVTGSTCATQFKLPPNTDLIKIPSITKNNKGQYVSRDFSESLEKTIKFRSKMLLDAFHMFKPDLIIMDNKKSTKYLLITLQKDKETVINTAVRTKILRGKSSIFKI